MSDFVVVDAEFSALDQMIKALQLVDRAAAIRIIRYLESRFVSDVSENTNQHSEASHDPQT